MKLSSAVFLIGDLVCVSSLAVCEAAEDTARAIAPVRRIELFDGKSLSGWTGFMQNNGELTQTWRVEGGLLKCTGKPNGYLRTEQSYRDYRLTIEWRFTKIAPRADNGGILVHMATTNKLWPRCLQCQGQHGKIGDLIFMDGSECKEHQGLTGDRLSSRDPTAERVVGEWNITEFLCIGDSVRIRVNGKLVNEATGCNVSSGCIGLQSEGAEFEVREISIEPETAP